MKWGLEWPTFEGHLAPLPDLCNLSKKKKSLCAWGEKKKTEEKKKRERAEGEFDTSVQGRGVAPWVRPGL